MFNIDNVWRHLMSKRRLCAKLCHSVNIGLFSEISDEVTPIATPVFTILSFACSLKKHTTSKTGKHRIPGACLVYFELPKLFFFFTLVNFNGLFQRGSIRKYFYFYIKGVSGERCLFCYYFVSIIVIHCGNHCPFCLQCAWNDEVLTLSCYCVNKWKAYLQDMSTEI